MQAVNNQAAGIIPLREKIGNYDMNRHMFMPEIIIPLREKIGNYDSVPPFLVGRFIIPLREKIGNYDNMLVLTTAR